MAQWIRRLTSNQKIASSILVVVITPTFFQGDLCNLEKLEPDMTIIGLFSRVLTYQPIKQRHTTRYNNQYVTSQRFQIRNAIKLVMSVSAFHVLGCIIM